LVLTGAAKEMPEERATKARAVRSVFMSEL
jgi:hypothetical protein